MADPEHGYGKLDVLLESDALAHPVNVAGGDARNALNALELAVETTPPDLTTLARVMKELRAAFDRDAIVTARGDRSGCRAAESGARP